MTSVTELEPSEDSQSHTLASVQRPKPLGSLVASAKRLTTKELKRVGNSSKAEAWQEDAWEMFDLVGEQRFLATTLANRLAQARFFVGELPRNTTEDIVPLEEGPAYDAFDTMVGKGSHFTQMIARLGLNLFIPGDGYLVGIPPKEDPKSTPLESPKTAITPIGSDEVEHDPLEGIDLTTLDWQMYSLNELEIDDKSGEVTLKRGGKRTCKADSLFLLRVWRSHPRFWEQADSPTRSSLPVLRELVGLTMHISAQVDSRLAGAGVFLVPSSADQAMRAASGATDDEDLSPFADALMEAMITPISDRSNASAIVPLMPVVPDESIEKFRYISFSSPLDAEARSLRDEAIRRLALGQDCPPELLLGVAGMNHWGAWLVREDVVTTHLEPPLALICDAITTQFLWPVLEQQGVEDFEKYAVWYDVDHMINRPNKSADAAQGHAAGVLSDEAYRDALGFDESDAPAVEPKDPVTDLVLAMIREAPSLMQNPGLDVIATQVRALIENSPVPSLADLGAQESEAGEAGKPVEESPEESSTEDGVPSTEDSPAPEGTEPE